MQSSLTQVTIATANTHWGQMLTTTDGLRPVAEADILLLQEAINVEEVDIKDRLRRAGFDLIYTADRFGLAIGLRLDSGLAVKPNSLKERRLQRMSPIERQLTQKGAKRTHEFTEHGMIAAKFITKGGYSLTVVNVHLSVPLKPRARAAQIAAIGQELTGPYYDGSLIVGGDMNHYRGPTTADSKMRTEATLQSVDLNNEPTWYARGSKQERYLKVGAFFRKRPIEYYDGHHDTILYRGKELRALPAKVVDIPSDHRAIIAQFETGADAPMELVTLR